MIQQATELQMSVPFRLSWCLTGTDGILLNDRKVQVNGELVSLFEFVRNHFPMNVFSMYVRRLRQAVISTRGRELKKGLEPLNSL